MPAATAARRSSDTGIAAPRSRRTSLTGSEPRSRRNSLLLASEPPPKPLPKSFLKELHELFDSFACFTGRDSEVGLMDSTKWKKFCKDSNLIDKQFTQVDVDMTFQKAKAGDVKLSFKQFPVALRMIAQKRGCELEDVAAVCFAAGGPTDYQGTVPDYCRFHDDEMYWSDEEEGAEDFPSSSTSGACSPGHERTSNAKALGKVFRAFASADGHMTLAQFLVLLGECKVVGSGPGQLTPVEAEDIFSKNLERPHSCKYLEIHEFHRAVEQVAAARHQGTTVLVCQMVISVPASATNSGLNTPRDADPEEGDDRLVDGGDAAAHHRAVLEGLQKRSKKKLAPEGVAELTLAAWQAGQEMALEDLRNSNELLPSPGALEGGLRRASVGLGRSKSGFPDDDDEDGF